MSKRFEYICEKYDFVYHICIKDHKLKCSYSPCLEFDMKRLVCTLNEQEIIIAGLEEQLSNAIIPKFKPHNDLFVIIDYSDGTKGIEQYYIDEIVLRGNGTYIEYRDKEQEMVIGENNLLFETYEEALAKLEELKNE